MRLGPETQIPPISGTGRTLVWCNTAIPSRVFIRQCLFKQTEKFLFYLLALLKVWWEVASSELNTIHFPYNCLTHARTHAYTHTHLLLINNTVWFNAST